MRRIESKKPVGESFLWSVMAASPMYDPPYQSWLSGKTMKAVWLSGKTMKPDNEARLARQ